MAQPYVFQEYPKDIGGKIVKNAAEEAVLRASLEPPAPLQIAPEVPEPAVAEKEPPKEPIKGNGKKPRPVAVGK